MIAAGVNAKALSTYMGHAVDRDHAGPLRPLDAGKSEEEPLHCSTATCRPSEQRAEEAARMHGECLTGELTGEQVGAENRETA